MSSDIRSASVSRKTSETEISVSIQLDQPLDGSTAKISVDTGIGFLDHVRSRISALGLLYSCPAQMFTALSKHGGKCYTR